LLIKSEDTILLHKRTEKDIWQNLYDFPLIEATTILTKEELVTTDFFENLMENQDYQITKRSKPFKQLLTHQKIIALNLHSQKL